MSDAQEEPATSTRTPAVLLVAVAVGLSGCALYGALMAPVSAPGSGAGWVFSSSPGAVWTPLALEVAGSLALVVLDLTVAAQALRGRPVAPAALMVLAAATLACGGWFLAVRGHHDADAGLLDAVWAGLLAAHLVLALCSGDPGGPSADRARGSGSIATRPPGSRAQVLVLILVEEGLSK